MEIAAFDILGLGCLAVDDLLYVEHYPAADSKTPVLHRQRQGGGLTGTALAAAARMGASCQYASRLGNDELSRFMRQRMHEEGIGLEYARNDERIRPVYSLVIVDEADHTRTILYDVHGATCAAADWPSEQVIRAARVLFVDSFGIPGMIRAARIAHSAGIPVVADFECISPDEDFAELVSLVDHPIVPMHFARQWTGCECPDDAVEAMLSQHCCAAAITCGAEGCWYISAETCRKPQHQPAFPVEVVDTTGCGDVFHGVYAATLAHGFDLPTRIRWASAAAALKAKSLGGQAGIPQHAIVEQFLENYPLTLEVPHA